MYLGTLTLVAITSLSAAGCVRVQPAAALAQRPAGSPRGSVAIGPQGSATLLAAAAAEPATAASSPVSLNPPLRRPITNPGPAAPLPFGATHVVRETRVSSLSSSCNDAFEPIVATHPTDPMRIAAAYQRYRAIGGRCHLDPVVAVSHDGGATWRISRGRPWAGSGRSPDHHAAIAWGPGPHAGSSRLYWTDMTVDRAGGHLASVAWSDDEGATWSLLYVERRTPPWIGGFPDITVDRDPFSPNYGVVYVAYNWLGDPSRGPGLHLLASADYGRTWRATEIAPAPAPRRFGDAFRIADRVRTAPDGAVYVSTYQADLRVWDNAHIFAKGGNANVARLGIVVTRVSFHRRMAAFSAGPSRVAIVLPRDRYTVSAMPANGTTDHLDIDPMWSQSLDVDPVTGRVFLAVGDYRPRLSRAMPRGSIHVGHSDDGGHSWKWVTIPALSAVAGRSQSSIKPSLTVAGGTVFVGFHSITDVPDGTSPLRHIPTIGTFYAVSFDGGASFDPPTTVSGATWNVAALAGAPTGSGLRERAERTADGGVFFGYGDGRLSAPAAAGGRSAIFGSLIAIARVEFTPDEAAEVRLGR